MRNAIPTIALALGLTACATAGHQKVQPDEEEVTCPSGSRPVEGHSTTACLPNGFRDLDHYVESCREAMFDLIDADALITTIKAVKRVGQEPRWECHGDVVTQPTPTE